MEVEHIRVLAAQLEVTEGPVRTVEEDLSRALRRWTAQHGL
jgi:hypothetical protein